MKLSGELTVNNVPCRAQYGVALRTLSTVGLPGGISMRKAPKVLAQYYPTYSSRPSLWLYVKVFAAHITLCWRAGDKRVALTTPSNNPTQSEGDATTWRGQRRMQGLDHYWPSQPLTFQLRAAAPQPRVLLGNTGLRGKWRSAPRSAVECAGNRGVSPRRLLRHGE